MKANVPPGLPGSSDQACRSRAMPKSISLGSPLLVHQDVLGLDVTVEDPSPVCEVSRCRDLRQQSRSLAGLQLPLRGDLLEGAAADVFHHQVGPVVMEIEVKDADQIGMLQLGQDPPLLDDLVPAAGLHRTERELEHQVLRQPGMHDPKDLGLPGSGQTGL